jgi:hypothetical protein
MRRARRLARGAHGPAARVGDERVVADRGLGTAGPTGQRYRVDVGVGVVKHGAMLASGAHRLATYSGGERGSTRGRLTGSPECWGPCLLQARAWHGAPWPWTTVFMGRGTLGGRQLLNGLVPSSWYCHGRPLARTERERGRQMREERRRGRQFLTHGGARPRTVRRGGDGALGCGGRASE